MYLSDEDYRVRTSAKTYADDTKNEEFYHRRNGAFGEKRYEEDLKEGGPMNSEEWAASEGGREGGLAGSTEQEGEGSYDSLELVTEENSFGSAQHKEESSLFNPRSAESAEREGDLSQSAEQRDDDSSAESAPSNPTKDDDDSYYSSDWKKSQSSGSVEYTEEDSSRSAEQRNDGSSAESSPSNPHKDDDDSAYSSEQGESRLSDRVEYTEADTLFSEQREYVSSRSTELRSTSPENASPIKAHDEYGSSYSRSSGSTEYGKDNSAIPGDERHKVLSRSAERGSSKSTHRLSGSTEGDEISSSSAEYSENTSEQVNARVEVSSDKRGREGRYYNQSQRALPFSPEQDKGGQPLKIPKEVIL